jgi:hypothetical protein
MLRHVSQPQARDQAAATAGTNPRYVSDAKLVKEKAPALFEQVKAGAVSIAAARVELKLANEYRPCGFACRSCASRLLPITPAVSRFTRVRMRRMYLFAFWCGDRIYCKSQLIGVPTCGAAPGC